MKAFSAATHQDSPTNEDIAGPDLTLDPSESWQESEATNVHEWPACKRLKGSRAGVLLPVAKRRPRENDDASQLQVLRD